MGRAKKKPEDSGPPGAPEWIVTFTDMISLLVTFFVLLMTFSSLNEYDILRVDSFLKGGRGVDAKQGSAPTAPQNDVLANTDMMRGALVPHVRPPDEIQDDIAEIGQKATDEDIQVDFERMPDGLVIQFGANDRFTPGSTVVPDHLRDSLAAVGRVLEHYPHLVVLEGYAEPGFVPSARHPSAEELSFARAEAASQVLLSQTGMVPELLQVAGRGARGAETGDPTPVDPATSGQVRLRVLSLSRGLSQYYEGEVRPRREEEGR